jgi:hypothetical protein
VTAWNQADEQCLVAVALEQDSIKVNPEPWQAVGMGATASADVDFNQCLGSFVGIPGEYVNRPGFWHGGGRCRGVLVRSRDDVGGSASCKRCGEI